MTDTRTLEELLSTGEVESALILKGDFTPGEVELVRRAYTAGVKAGKNVSLLEAAAELLADAGVDDIDPRLGYLQLQVTRSVWERFREALERPAARE